MNAILKMMFEYAAQNGKTLEDVMRVISTRSIKERSLIEIAMFDKHMMETVSMMVKMDYISRVIVKKLDIDKKIPEFVINYLKRYPNTKKIIEYCKKKGASNDQIKFGILKLSNDQRMAIDDIKYVDKLQYSDILNIADITESILESAGIEPGEETMFSPRLMKYLKNNTSDFYIAISTEEVASSIIHKFLINYIGSREKEILFKVYDKSLRNVTLNLNVSDNDIDLVERLKDTLKEQFRTSISSRPYVPSNLSKPDEKPNFESFIILTEDESEEALKEISKRLIRKFAITKIDKKIYPFK